MSLGHKTRGRADRCDAHDCVDVEHGKVHTTTQLTRKGDGEVQVAGREVTRLRYRTAQADWQRTVRMSHDMFEVSKRKKPNGP